MLCVEDFSKLLLVVVHVNKGGAVRFKNFLLRLVLIEIVW
jgi:hypothetical protein